MCRASNYAALLRKGLRDAGYPQVPVIALSVQGIEDNPGFHLGIPHIHKAIQAFVIGDAIQSMLLRVRPYEATPGSAMELYRTWDGYVQEWITSGRVAALGGRVSYGKIIRECVRAFDALPLRDIPRKPRVGLVGEILVKFHPDANNHAVDVIEAEGCEAELPGLMQFFHNSVATAAWDKENLGIEGKQRYIMPIVLWALKKYEKPVHRAFAATNGKFEPHRPIEEMISRSQDIARLGNQAGEGWYLTAEMVDMIEHGCPNIICAQPFACLPNHVVGKGMFRALRTRYPEANIVAVDYAPVPPRSTSSTASSSCWPPPCSRRRLATARSCSSSTSKSPRRAAGPARSCSACRRSPAGGQPSADPAETPRGGRSSQAPSPFACTPPRAHCPRPRPMFTARA